MAIFPRFNSAGNGPADGPLQNGGRPVVVSFELEQNRSGLWVASQIVLRMVRPLGADGPPPTKNYGTETLRFLCVLIG
jgi:hypothetical protein